MTANYVSRRTGGHLAAAGARDRSFWRAGAGEPLARAGLRIVAPVPCGHLRVPVLWPDSHETCAAGWCEDPAHRRDPPRMIFRGANESARTVQAPRCHYRSGLLPKDKYLAVVKGHRRASAELAWSKTDHCEVHRPCRLGTGAPRTVTTRAETLVPSGLWRVCPLPRCGPRALPRRSCRRRARAVCPSGLPPR